MKKKLLSAVLLSSVLLSACASKDTDKKDANDTPDTSEAVTEESAEETTEATTTETEATEKSEETKPSETTASPYEKAHVARWVDANLNFAHDADDSYLLNGVNVSMADYYSALDKDPVMKCVDAFYNLYRSPLGYDEVFESALTECDYITTTQIEFESPGITEGEVPTDTVRIDEENCVTYYTIDVPQLTLSGSDIDKANKAIIEFAQASDPWFGPPKVRYQHIERDDGSKTVIFFLGDGYDDSEFKVFNFDKDNKLMSADAVIESAGWEPAVFKTEAKKTIAQALVYADEIAIKAQGFGINSDYISAIDDPSDILVNKNGNLVVFAYSSIAGTQGYFRIGGRIRC